jgi:hypothetical protein
MIRKKSTAHVFLSIFAVLAISLSAFADTIRLKDGSIIKGTIVGFADGRFTVSIGEGSRRRELSLEADEIASIEFDSLANTGTARNEQSTGNSKIVPISVKSQPRTDSANNNNVPPADVDNDAVNTPAKSTTATNTRTQAAPPIKQPAPTQSSSSEPGKAITFNVRVLADNTANGWTNSGFVVKKGQRIRITGSGSVSLGKGRTSTPSGLYDLDDPDKLLKSVPTGALLAVIGDDNNDFIYIGETREFTAGRDGALYLGVNEGNLNDNSGSFDVKIEVIPDI